MEYVPGVRPARQPRAPNKNPGVARRRPDPGVPDVQGPVPRRLVSPVNNPPGMKLNDDKKGPLL